MSFKSLVKGQGRAKIGTVTRWYMRDGEPGGVWTGWGWRNKEGHWFHR